MAYVLATVSGVWTIASILVIALRGNLIQPWTTLDGSEAMVGFLHTLPYLNLLGLMSSSMFDGLESKSSALSLRFLCGRSPSSPFGASTCLSESESSSSAPLAAVLCTSPHLSIFLAQSNARQIHPHRRNSPLLPLPVRKFRPHRHQHHRQHPHRSSPRIMSHLRLYYLSQALPPARPLRLHCQQCWCTRVRFAIWNPCKISRPPPTCSAQSKGQTMTERSYTERAWTGKSNRGRWRRPQAQRRGV
jgi:hypothetical protein